MSREEWPSSFWRLKRVAAVAQEHDGAGVTETVRVYPGHLRLLPAHSQQPVRFVPVEPFP